jgi:1-acyl-sn-glycerol-3-phosphate acyltransferase
MRRYITIPTIFVAAFSCIVLYIPILLIAALVSLHPNYRSAPHVWTFIVGYLLFECGGVLRLFWVWLVYRNSDQWILQNRYTQIWWAKSLLKLGEIVFRLRFETTGQEALEGSSALIFVRHCSLGDTVIPFPFFLAPRNNEGVRYIIKKELLVSPSLDIGGHRLTSLFVDRSGTDTERELAAIRELTAGAPPDESVLVYPEGTRHSLQKKAQLLERHPNLRPQLERWPDLLPPRLGGVKSMLEANPGKDAVFIAHTGFEGSANLAELLSGSWHHMTIRIHLWRVPFAEIPADHEAFFLEQWDRMQTTVAELAAQG